MSELPIEANICEPDGTCYPVKLCTIPRVGELIDLHSFNDEAAKHPPQKYYEVVQVVHRMYDVVERDPQFSNGFQVVKIFVKPKQSKFFKSSVMPSSPPDLN